MKDFIDELSRLLKYEYRELIEVDLILYNIFSMLSQNKYFCNNFLLKGGTCLIKNYLDYYRFSEDIDLTWKNQNIFKKKSNREKKEYKSNIINIFGNIIKEICDKLNLDFINDKRNDKYYHFSGDYMVNLKLYYNSEILNVERVLRIEIVLIECLKFQPEIGRLKSLIVENEELNFLFPEEYTRYSKEITIPIYNINEILCEKVRAILTRKVLKSRDFIDIYFILDKFNLNIKDFKAQIIEKTLFTLKSERFKKNLIEKLGFIKSGDLFSWEDEKRLLLKKIDDNRFNIFLKQFNDFLKTLTDEILDKIE